MIIYNIVRLAIKYRQALMIAGAILAVFGAYQWAKHQGRKECKMAYEKAVFEANQKAQFEIRKVQDAYRQKKANIPAQDSGYGVGPIVTSVFNSLPDRTDR